MEARYITGLKKTDADTRRASIHAGSSKADAAALRRRLFAGGQDGTPASTRDATALLLASETCYVPHILMRIISARTPLYTPATWSDVSDSTPSARVHAHGNGSPARHTCEQIFEAEIKSVYRPHLFELHLAADSRMVLHTLSNRQITDYWYPKRL